MNTDFNTISMVGRMAYVIMCVERFLVAVYPEKDWKLIAKKMWKATSHNWGDWPIEFYEIFPEFIFSTNGYNSEEYEYISEDEYHIVLDLYNDITSESKNDMFDTLKYILKQPFEMAMVYEGTVIGDGKESIKIIENSESVLLKNNIALPDGNCLKFSSFSQRNGWGDDFEGEKLSIILN
ncbi:hypothetical protein BCR32DRAFT_4648 [Anaeromyces robustus]|uniref:Uncharacterized protein n=1 Tax=Anaeromyces robustus TaxID=1754192 RepID=A0A1Y1X8H9_9FUNG|nr:hypothetical protein BCR32DRAFT_4648 [Anaeromyces robustus]|eukprot:ORX82071.1 hypothetical protein BCR32DRAFT_4648 [Anaeromyces robustus]